MKDRHEKFRQLERTAGGRWAEIIRALSCVDISDAIERRRHIRCHRDHGKTNAQFRVFKDFNQTGGGVCNTCGPFSNGFALLGFLNGWDYKTAVKEVAQFLEGRVISTPPRPSHAPKRTCSGYARSGKARTPWPDPSVRLTCVLEGSSAISRMRTKFAFIAASTTGTTTLVAHSGTSPGLCRWSVRPSVVSP